MSRGDMASIVMIDVPLARAYALTFSSCSTRGLTASLARRIVGQIEARERLEMIGVQSCFEQVVV